MLIEKKKKKNCAACFCGRGLPAHRRENGCKYQHYEKQQQRQQQQQKAYYQVHNNGVFIFNYNFFSSCSVGYFTESLTLQTYLVTS